MLLTTLKDQFLYEISKDFDPKLKAAERLKIIADLEMYSKEDPYVWAQGKGKVSLCFQVFFDGEFISLFDENFPVEKAKLDFWRGFKEAYERGKIKLIPQEYVIEEAAKKEEKKSLKEKVAALPESTPIERQAKHIIKNLTREKHGKPA